MDRPPHRLPWLFAAAFAAAPLCLIAALFAALAVAQPAQAPRTAVLLTIDGAIGPAAADYVKRELARSHESGAVAVVLQMDTPGGLDTSMREIIRAILAAPVPVLTYVAPSGARAASAGTYILYASHIAAMAPGTNLGAATPVQLGGGGGGDNLPGQQPQPAASPPRDGASAPAQAGRSAMEAKTINDAVAYIRSLAELRGRNAAWAERAVRESVSLPAHEAVQQRVVDLMAASVPELLDKAHGRNVRLGAGSVTLDTAGLEVRSVEPDWRTRMLGVIGNPNIALILMMVGVYGLLFEFMNPGTLFPGVIGGISLLVGLYALSVLPLAYVGVALLLLGLALMLAEGFAPSFGILGIGGAIAFVLGASLLVDTEAPGFAVSLPLAAGIAAATLGFSVLVVRLALRARRQRGVSGAEGLVGASARVLDWSGSAGHVFVAGERWAARGASGLLPGQTVQVQTVQGLTLVVTAEPAARPPLEKESTR